VVRDFDHGPTTAVLGRWPADRASGQFRRSLPSTPVRGSSRAILVEKKHNPCRIRSKSGRDQQWDTGLPAIDDPHNQCWEAEGLYVTDAACFPAQGSQNLTLTILALTARACDHALRTNRPSIPTKGEPISGPHQKSAFNPMKLSFRRRAGPGSCRLTAVAYVADPGRCYSCGRERARHFDTQTAYYHCLLSHTPRPPPFLWMNSTLAPSKARPMTSKRVARRSCLVPVSNGCTVTTQTPPSYARPCWLRARDRAPGCLLALNRFDGLDAIAGRVNLRL
jgi:hypothetical protein